MEYSPAISRRDDLRSAGINCCLTSQCSASHLALSINLEVRGSECDVFVVPTCMCEILCVMFSLFSELLPSAKGEDGAAMFLLVRVGVTVCLCVFIYLSHYESLSKFNETFRVITWWTSAVN